MKRRRSSVIVASVDVGTSFKGTPQLVDLSVLGQRMQIRHSTVFQLVTGDRITATP